MRICVFGAGAVGGHIAARLAASGLDPAVVARGAQLEALRGQGIRLRSGGTEVRAAVRCTAEPSDLGPQDLVVVTVKGPALPGIVDGLLPLLDGSTALVMAQNGIPWWYFHNAGGGRYPRCLDRLDPGHRLHDEIGADRVIGCVVYSANEVVEPGIVLNRSPHRNRLVLGEPDGSRSSRVLAVASLLERAGFEAPVTTDIRAAIWRKFLAGNLTLSLASALTGAPADGVARDPRMQEVCRQLACEGLALAGALGVDLTDLDPARELDPARIPAGNRPSMLQDLERGRPMEIDGFVGAVRDLATAVGVKMPTFETVAAILELRAREAGLWPG